MQYADDEEYCYWLLFTFAEDVNEEKQDAITAAYREMLEQAGFVEANITDWDLTGLYNPETNEVILSFGFVEGNLFEVDVVVYSAEAAATYIEIVAEAE